MCAGAWCDVCWCVAYHWLSCPMLLVEDHFPLPPPPDHPPPPLRRSTLDIVELMREELHHSSQGEPAGARTVGQAPLHSIFPSLCAGVLHSRAFSSSSDNHYRVSSSALRQPNSFPDLHSPVYSSDSSLANNGPTQTPPPELLSDSLWNKVRTYICTYCGVQCL